MCSPFEFLLFSFILPLSLSLSWWLATGPAHTMIAQVETPAIKSGENTMVFSHSVDSLLHAALPSGCSCPAPRVFFCRGCPSDENHVRGPVWEQHSLGASDVCSLFLCFPTKNSTLARLSTLSSVLLSCPRNVLGIEFLFVSAEEEHAMSRRPAANLVTLNWESEDTCSVSGRSLFFSSKLSTCSLDNKRRGLVGVVTLQESSGLGFPMEPSFTAGKCPLL